MRHADYDAIPTDFSNRIIRLRVQLGLPQARLAELLQVTTGTVNRWESGQTKPPPAVWLRLTRAERLGVDALRADYAETHVAMESSPAYEAYAHGQPPLDFGGNPEAVRLVIEAERLAYGHLYNPAFATEISQIDPLPHQRLAVYQHLLAQPRLRFLLADDAGAGKTIMAGLYIREMLNRRLIQRVLIVPPAGLVSNWRREMHTLFSLPFQIVTGSDARNGNPFDGADSNLLIVSVDTLASERMFGRLGESMVAPYDLVIFDEAHKLSADREADFRVRKTDRYRLAEALAGVLSDDERWQLLWSTHHLLLLTATPHMGKDLPYYYLWRLLEPEALSTYDAFTNYPPAARQRHFIRRTKEEMVRFDQSPIYPQRISNTFSYDLTQGPISEQALYDATTDYIEHTYNRARILNRSAARLAMSIFQRRLASSTDALRESFKRRREKLDGLIGAIESGELNVGELLSQQRKLDSTRDVLNDLTADEEVAEGDQEQNQSAEDLALGGVVAASLAELIAERAQVDRLWQLAGAVIVKGDESKFEKLHELLRDPRYAEEKFIIFTEHKDTLDFLVRRLKGLGFDDQVAAIHGGLSARADPKTGLSERDEQVEFFRQPVDRGGARYLVATDAAGEGINLQFAWLMINYDVPWNPARLEQRLGRIHRYGQKHDPVFIFNLLAGKTREGRVLQTLLDKLERIRRELRSDKVFDVVGRLFEGVSLKDFMEQAVTESGAEAACRVLEGTLTKDQVQALAERDRRTYGEGGDVRRELAALTTQIELETYRRLLPGFVRQFIEHAAPLLNVKIDGDLDGVFGLQPTGPGALDVLWPVLETYPLSQQNHFTVYRPVEPKSAVFLHPGEVFFDRLSAYVSGRFNIEALRGAVFIDPTATAPYLFHLALITIKREADPQLSSLARDCVLEQRLIGLKQTADGALAECPIEAVLLLKNGAGLPSSAIGLAARAPELIEAARQYAVEGVARSGADSRRAQLLATLDERENFIRIGYDYRASELAAQRTHYAEKAQAGDARAQAEVTKIRERQKQLQMRRAEALKTLHREPDLIVPGEVTVLAHALVVPSSDPVDRKQRDDAIEAIAMQVAWAYEASRGATVKDVHTPQQSRATGLGDHPGFDLLSIRDKERRNIEVKGRARVGDVELTENEWPQACNLGEQYWLYVVYDCATPTPHLLRVQNPFKKLIARAKGGVVINEQEIFGFAEA
ncbi:MAG: DUF3883 domain-containing protein [Thermoflexales bacterium]|nr:DUF3883 domain-containing protein [Thermoflexales bacterium]